jgi:hypothetical protein
MVGTGFGFATIRISSTPPKLVNTAGSVMASARAACGTQISAAARPIACGNRRLAIRAARAAMRDLVTCFIGRRSWPSTQATSWRLMFAGLPYKIQDREKKPAVAAAGGAHSAERWPMTS